MNRRRLTVCTIVSIAAAAVSARAAGPVGTAFTYQGQLKQNGLPVEGPADFEFSLWDAESGDGQIGGVLAKDAVDAHGGLFTVELDFGAGAWTGEARWLRVGVRYPAWDGQGGEPPFIVLGSRQAISPAPYALALPALYTVPNATSPNIVGGWTNNEVTPGVVGATLSGGGSPLGGGNPRPNKITDNYGTISGGSGNIAGNNDADTANSDHATVGGGYANEARGSVSTVGGGWYNRATAGRATVGGGWNNQATGVASTVAGGRDNLAGGENSVVAGGSGNKATNWGAMALGGVYSRAEGICSFAAGRRAIAAHHGSFVWADYNDADFTTTGQNQFVIRAGGGVGVNTAAPKTTLDVAGLARVLGSNWPSAGEGMELAYNPDLNRGYIQVFDRSANTWGDLYLGDGKVGIGTTTPNSKLTVVGTIESTSGGMKFPDGTVQTTAGSGLGLTLPYSGSCECGDPRLPRPAFEVTHTSTGNTAYVAGELHGAYGESHVSMSGFPLRITGAGVLGKHTTGGNGVRGESDGGTGVRGNGATGVVGVGDSTGVLGIGDTYGVFGESTLGHAAYFTGKSYIAGPLGVGTDIPVNPLDVEAPGTTIGGNSGYDEVVARFRQNDPGHSAVSIDSEAGQDSILYFAEDGRAHWDIRHDEDDSDSLNIRYHGGTDQNWSVLRVLSNGTTRVRVLEIVGGADLAEPFEVNPSRDKTEAVEPGMVVVIDPENPGELKLSTEPYDRKVAGVISGANGLQPGMMMKSADSPLADGDHPVALTGRVWCRCDAAFGAIEPGDLLTTSTTPGHAKKAADPARTQGAVLGKAMTSLSSGRGLVLVLVSLQ